jgi:hypothetical protein
LNNSKQHGDDLFFLAKTFINKLADGTISKSEAISFLQSGRAAPGPPVSVAVQLSEWGAFFEATGCICDMSTIAAPRYRPGLDQLIVVPSGMTVNRIVELMRAKFDVWIHPEFGDDIDAAVPHNQRTNDRTYAIWAHDQVESDEEFRNLSADDIKARDIPAMTLLERLLYGIFRFHQKRDHLDVAGGTLCAGSRTFSGKVPCVEWGDEDCQLGIIVGSLQRGSPLTRARQIVN